jgi:mRNA interferase MazF
MVNPATTGQASWVPDAYDLVWLGLDPQLGREQAGRRPAMVLTPARYNRLVGLCLVCPITSKVKNYPFEVVVPSGSAITGVVLADQVRSVDWSMRNMEFIENRRSMADAIQKALRRLLSL